MATPDVVTFGEGVRAMPQATFEIIVDGYARRMKETQSADVAREYADMIARFHAAREGRI